MKFCLLVTVALDIFIKEKNNTLYFPWIFQPPRYYILHKFRTPSPSSILDPSSPPSPHPPFVRHPRVSKSYCMLPITHKTKSWEKTCL